MKNQRELTLRFLAEPSDVNFGGSVHGGVVMKWIDQAGFACASGWSNSYCVTVYVGGIRFYSPIKIGNLIEVNSKVVYTGKTSMHLTVDVFAKDPKANSDFQKKTHCIIIFVAVDSDGNPAYVPEWRPESEQDVELESYAKKLMALRKDIETEMHSHL